jgi:hypothetical protein
MRDPAENKDILPNISSLRPSPDDDRAIEEVYAQIKAARNRMRVLSLPPWCKYWERKRQEPEYRERRRASARRRDRERRAQDPAYLERRRENNRRYRERKRARVPDAPRGANDGK